MVTSRTQNTRFSIPKWLRHSSSSLVGSASCGGSRFRLLSYAKSKRNRPEVFNTDQGSQCAPRNAA